MAPPESQHVFVRFSSLGDLVLCTALVAAVRRAHPSAPLHFVTTRAFLPLLERFPGGVSPVGLTALERRSFRKSHLFWEARAVARKLFHQNRHIILYDLHGVPKSALVILAFRLARWEAGGNARLEVRRTRKHTFARMLSVLLRRDLLGPRHVFREHLRLAGPELDASHLDASQPEASHRDAPQRNAPQPETPHLESRETGLSARRILLAPDAQRWKKRWLVSHWRILIMDLLNAPEGFELTLVGGERTLPPDLLSELATQFPGRVHNRLGSTALTDLPDIARAHALTVCGNSAWLHLTEAVGRPVVALAGPIVPGFGFSPWRPDSAELSVPNLRCRPCTRHGGGWCSQRGERFHACMKFIAPSTVLSEVRRRLKGSP